jgi:hypothetical protein
LLATNALYDSLDNTLMNMQEHVAEGRAIFDNAMEDHIDQEMSSETAHLKRSQEEMEETDCNLKRSSKR